MWSPGSSITGATVTGLTSPTYGITQDSADAYAKKYAVISLGGTQTGVNVHSPALPFTITVKRPARLKTLGVKNPITGMYNVIPSNEYSKFVHKAAAVQSGQYGVCVFERRARIPAGAETYDAVNVKAGWSMFAGDEAQNLADHVDTTLTGII